MRYQIYRYKALAAYNHCCAWCGSQHDLCLDHVQTQATGGADTFDNLQVLCRPCNSIKNKWTMPKLPPRDPQTDNKKIRQLRDVLRYKIMPRRRQTAPNNHVPRKIKSLT
jgi:5-methylcytosine-specific restriction endonuclease McrA